MIIGCVKEIKNGENRVGLTPAGTGMLTKNGHSVLIEKGAGIGSGFSDEEYLSQGAKLCSAKESWEKSEMMVKVKEPIPSEYQYLREGLIVFTYLHLAAEKELTIELLKKKVIGIAYETIELADGFKPLLSPMSEVAGRMAVQIGMHYLERTNGGSGKLLSGVSGVLPGKVTIIGTGMAGMNAAKIAHGIGAKVTMIGIMVNEFRKINDVFSGQVSTCYSTPQNIQKAVEDSDLVIGSVAITGAATPKLVTREMVKRMKRGSVIIDISIDQGGCFETSRPTSHASPTYVEEGVIHYCVTNMPGAVPNTSTVAMTNVTIPYAIKLANLGVEEAAGEDPILAKGINTFKGKLTNKQVAESLGLEYSPL